MQLIARAPDTGRSSSHLSSPRTARVAKAESSRGGGKRTGLSASHAATTTPCLALRFQTGSRTSGVDAHRVHALQGCECREKTHRLKCDPVEVMATVLSRRRPTCCWSKTAVAKEPRARRLGDPHAVPNDGLGAHDEGRGCPRMCMHNDVGHRPEVPLEGRAARQGGEAVRPPREPKGERESRGPLVVGSSYPRRRLPRFGSDTTAVNRTRGRPVDSARPWGRRDGAG
jgi:hypothetical protein